MYTENLLVLLPFCTRQKQFFLIFRQCLIPIDLNLKHIGLKINLLSTSTINRLHLKTKFDGKQNFPLLKNKEFFSSKIYFPCSSKIMMGLTHPKSPISMAQPKKWNSILIKPEYIPLSLSLSTLTLRPSAANYENGNGAEPLSLIQSPNTNPKTCHFPSSSPTLFRYAPIQLGDSAFDSLRSL